MTVLGIETSTAVCSVGIASLNDHAPRQIEEQGLLVERSIIESHIHSEKLLTLIMEICDKNNMVLSQMDGIAVSIGPGSFTGLRIGLSTVKGLCYALAKPLVSVSTFEAVATGVFMSHPDLEKIIVCVDAKQGESYRGVYEIIDGKITEVFPVQIESISSPYAIDGKKTIVVTDLVDLVKKSVTDSLPVEDIFKYCRGDVTAKIALKKLQEGKNDVLENIEPLYLKDFIIRSHVKLN